MEAKRLCRNPFISQVNSEADHINISSIIKVYGSQSLHKSGQFRDLGGDLETMKMVNVAIPS